MKFSSYVHAFVLWALFCSPVSFAQSAFPSKPLKILVGYPAGGPVDVLARIYGMRLSKSIDQPVIIENKPGASGSMAADQMVKSPSDGYTLLLAPVTIAIISSLIPKLPYETSTDLQAVAWIASAPFVLVSHPKLGFKNIPELIAFAKNHPGEINFASASAGGIPHLAGEMFSAMAGVKMTHVPYKGAAPATTDLLSGQVNLMFDSVVSALPYIKSNRLIPLGVTGAKRLPLMPEVSPISEYLAGYEANGWYGFFIQKEAPKQIVQRLNQEINQLTKTAEVDQLIKSNGLDPVVTTPGEFAAYFASEIAKWRRTVRSSDIKAD